MRMRRRHCRGQSYTEYAIGVAAIIASAVIMQTYVKRAVQAVVKDGTDNMLRIDEEDVTGELTQERAMPRPVELLSSTADISGSGTARLQGNAGGQTSNSNSTNTRTSQERYLELEGPLGGGTGAGTGDDGAPPRGGGGPWSRRLE